MPRAIFRHLLQMRDFGEFLYQGERPVIRRHVFASIDSLGDGAAIDPAAFDHLILDEAHHSAAESWTTLLKQVSPKELLGLTGTPERADGLDYERSFPRPWIGNLASGTPSRTRWFHFATTCLTWKAPTCAT